MTTLFNNLEITSEEYSISNNDLNKIILITSIHKILKTLFLVKRQINEPNINFTLIRFMIICCLSNTGNFNNLPIIGQNIAILQNWCKVIVFYEIYININNNLNIEDYTKIQQLKYLFDGQLTVYSSLKQISRLVASFALNESLLPIIIWDKLSTKTLFIKGKKISINDISNAAKFSINKVKSIIDILLSGYIIKDVMNYNNIYDQLENNDPGYSFIIDNNNKFNGLFNSLIKYFYSKRNLKNKYFSNNSESNYQNKYNYLNKCSELIEWILISIHLTYGQPARGTELTSTQIINPSFGFQNIFWINNTIAISTYYSKMSSISQSNRTIIRFLPIVLSELVVKYLIYIRPIERFFAYVIYNKEKANLYSNYLFVSNGKLLNTLNISSMLEKVFKSVDAPPLFVHEYRHIAIAFMEKNLRLNPNILDTNDLFDEQAGHSHLMAVTNYAISQYDSRIATRDSIQEYYRCSVKWHELISKYYFINFY